MRQLAAFSLCLAALGSVQPADAHTLNPDVENVGQRLQYCSHDLFRAHQPDGTYLAEIAQEPLLDLYTGILGQALRRYFPSGSLTPPQPRSVPALRLLDDALNIGYSHQVPLRLERDAKVAVYFDLLRLEWTTAELQRVIGARRAVTRGGTVRGQDLGAALLAMTAADFHERLAWGPGHIANVIESIRDPASWSLDGVPLTVPQFQALVAELEANLASMTARQKIDLVGGHCLHFHPERPGANLIFAADTFGDVIHVFAEDPGTGGSPGLPGWFWWILQNAFGVDPPSSGEDGERDRGPGRDDDSAPPPEEEDPVCGGIEDPEKRRKCEEKRKNCLAGNVRSCWSGACLNQDDCNACCLAQAHRQNEGCGELGDAQTGGGAAETLTARPTLPLLSPAAGATCETALNKTHMTSCRRLCKGGGQI